MSEETEVKEEAAVTSDSQQESNEPTANFEREKSGLQEALLAERRKRQELEAQNKYLQQYQQMASQYQSKEPEDDEDEYTKEIKQYTQQQIQQNLQSALEKQYLDANPNILEQDPLTGKTWIEAKLEPILAKKPYLSSVISQAENRYARAMEIIDDYTPKSSDNEVRKKLDENGNKPGNPAGVAKGAGVSKLESLRSMSRKEFSEYRAQLRGRRPNIK